jgi:hypothetical protein
MKYLLILIVVAFASCEKTTNNTCVCQDGNNSQKELARYSEMNSVQCQTKQAEWKQINSGAYCTLK